MCLVWGHGWGTWAVIAVDAVTTLVSLLLLLLLLLLLQLSVSQCLAGCVAPCLLVVSTVPRVQLQQTAT